MTQERPTEIDPESTPSYHFDWGEDSDTIELEGDNGNAGHTTGDVADGQCYDGMNIIVSSAHS